MKGRYQLKHGALASTGAIFVSLAILLYGSFHKFTSYVLCEKDFYNEVNHDSSLFSSVPSRICHLALINVGNLRTGLSRRIQGGLHFVTEGFSDCHIDVFWCSEEDVRPMRIEDERFGPLGIKKAYYFDAMQMFDRMDECYRRVRVDQSILGEWSKYDWVVRHRPDLVWYFPPPRITTLNNDTIYARVRMVRNDNASDLEVSWWGNSVCPPNAPCIWRDTLVPVEQNVPCYLVDDQFAIIPKRYADIYFGFTKPNKPAHAPAILPAMHPPEWPEAETTRRIADSGAKFKKTPLSFHIMRDSGADPADHVFREGRDFSKDIAFCTFP